MDAGMVVLMTLSFGLLLLLVQRSERRRRRTAFVLLLPVAFVVVWYANQRGHQQEALVGFILALALNLFFWVLIGRYNPVGSSDSIKVMGLDD
ncbi:MAG: hypothetical protein HXY41_08165 [Chloroflexi bacterium]|nr:hypothetical protein [Chloroflexota bacterium]